jgi:hypothetical protein
MQPGGSCTINVTFLPTTVTSPKNATLNVNVAAPATNKSVTLTGTVAAPVWSVSPATLDFGSVAVTASNNPTQTVTVANTGTLPLTITSITRSGTDAGQFVVSYNCPVGSTFSLAPGASCAVGVTFNPSTIGLKGAQLNVNVAAPGTSKSVPLAGTGI